MVIIQRAITQATRFVSRIAHSGHSQVTFHDSRVCCGGLRTCRSRDAPTGFTPLGAALDTGEWLNLSGPPWLRYDLGVGRVAVAVVGRTGVLHRFVSVPGRVGPIVAITSSTRPPIAYAAATSHQSRSTTSTNPSAKTIAADRGAVFRSGGSRGTRHRTRTMRRGLRGRPGRDRSGR